MAANTVQCATIGALWQAALALWDQYATGVYTSWSASYTPNAIYRAWTITVTSGAGTDTFLLVPMDGNLALKMTLPELVGSPGFRSPPPGAYPSILPDSSNCVTSFRDGPWALKKDIFAQSTLSSLHGGDSLTSAGSFGCDCTVFYAAFFHINGEVVLDGTGVLSGVKAANTTYAYPTDFVGESVPVALVSGGSGTDLTALVAAVEDLATQEVDWTANNGGSVWSLYSRVSVP